MGMGPVGGWGRGGGWTWKRCDSPKVGRRRFTPHLELKWVSRNASTVVYTRDRDNS